VEKVKVQWCSQMTNERYFAFQDYRLLCKINCKRFLMQGVTSNSFNWLHRLLRNANNKNNIFEGLKLTDKISVVMLKWSWVIHTSMGVGRGTRSLGPPGCWKFHQKKVVYLVSSGKKQILLLLGTPRKSLKKFPSYPPVKNSSDAHAHKWTTIFKLNFLQNHI